MTIPSSLYRIQFNADLPLKKVCKLIPFFHGMGIDGIYGSPIFVSGQGHGYDVVDPLHLNPSLGTMEDFEDFINLLKEYKMAFVLDVIPNHMGIKNNPWWNDVLEKGVHSHFVDFFDIDWMPEKPQLQGKVLLPFLHDLYGKVLSSGMIQLIWQQGFWIKYQDFLFPVSLETYPEIFKAYTPQTHLSEKEAKEWLECIDIMTAIAKMDAEKINEGKPLKERLVHLFVLSEFIQKSINKIIESLNTNRDLLDKLLEKQHYRLSYWAVAGQEINYRRFFTINDLVAIHIEKKDVLETHHRWIFNLIESKKVDGLRIDHPDGLYEPKEYFDYLQSKKPSFVVIEKILDFKEKLPHTWNVQGTVGYDYLNVLNGLFVEKKNEKSFSKFYKTFTGKTIDFEELLYERKKCFINFHMAGEFNSLGWRIDQLSEKNKNFRDFTTIDITQAIKEIAACFPVYRTYVTKEGECIKRDHDYIVLAVEKAKLLNPQIDSSLFTYMRDLLSGEWKDQELIDCVLRFQQLTGPLMAKGLEDSCFFIYNRLISLNEVGGNPQNFGISKGEYHDFNREKREKWPLGFLATSTHDTKCSEDVRYRIDVLSEIPEMWSHYVKKWHDINQKYKKKEHKELFPDKNTEYYLYQMLLGLWPVEKERFWNCLHKSVREAGIYTSWRWPQENYEQILKEFVDNLFSSENKYFFPSFLELQKKIALYGAWNSLSALILKMGSCGIAEIYQGNEWENLCMMDPDNRKPIDYEKRHSDLEGSFRVKDLFEKKAFSSLKFLITSQCLNFRRNHKNLFLKGSYIPLKILGKKQEEAIAFMRSFENQHALIIASRFYSHFSGLPLNHSWEDTHVIIQKNLINEKEFTDILTKKSLNLQKTKNGYKLFLNHSFSELPFIFSSNIVF